jgi:hypothetical protein
MEAVRTDGLPALPQRKQDGIQVLVDKGKTLAEVGDVDDTGGTALADSARGRACRGAGWRRQIIVRPLGTGWMEQDPIPVSGVDLPVAVGKEIRETVILSKQPDELR